MTPEDAFLLDILSNPDDPAPRLIYADWLEDQNDPRAPYIRAGCKVLAFPAGTPQRRWVRETFRQEIPSEAGWPEVEGLVLTWPGLVSVFRYRLAEVMAWCYGRSLPLCTAEIQPLALGQSWPEGSQQIGWGEIVQRVALRRAAQLARLGKTPRWLAEDLAGGRLLVRLLEVNGATPGDTRGAAENLLKKMIHRSGRSYLDEADRPAWDTWLICGHEPNLAGHRHQADLYLLAWVPSHLVREIEQQMQDRPTPCLSWAEDFDRPFLHHLRDAGLIG